MTRSLFFALLVSLIGLAAWRAGAQAQHDQHHSQAALAPPPAIQVEHKHLHEQLEAALAAGGKTAEHAKAVAEVLVPHFEHEEAFAMPPLGLLDALAHDRPLTEEQVTKAIEMADRLRAEYDKMLDEHKRLDESLVDLAAAAREEGKAEALAFAEGLRLHAQNEEQVLYPAALLVGQYLKLRGAAHPGAHDEAARPGTR